MTQSVVESSPVKQIYNDNGDFIRSERDSKTVSREHSRPVSHQISQIEDIKNKDLDVEEISEQDFDEEELEEQSLNDDEEARSPQRSEFQLQSTQSFDAEAEAYIIVTMLRREIFEQNKGKCDTQLFSVIQEEPSHQQDSLEEVSLIDEQQHSGSIEESPR